MAASPDNANIATVNTTGVAYPAIHRMTALPLAPCHGLISTVCSFERSDNRKRDG